MKPPWQIACPFSMSGRTRHRDLGASRRRPRRSCMPSLSDAGSRSSIARATRSAKRLRLGGRSQRAGIAHRRHRGACASDCAARSELRRSAVAVLAVVRGEVGEHARDARGAERIAPGERTARIGDAFLHREVDVRGRRDALHRRIGRLVDEHRDGAHHDESRDVVEERHADSPPPAARRSRSRRPRHRSAPTRAIASRFALPVVEREVDEHEVRGARRGGARGRRAPVGQRDPRRARVDRAVGIRRVHRPVLDRHAGGREASRAARATAPHRRGPRPATVPSPAPRPTAPARPRLARGRRTRGPTCARGTRPPRARAGGRTARSAGRGRSSPRRSSSPRSSRRGRSGPSARTVPSGSRRRRAAARRSSPGRPRARRRGAAPRRRTGARSG